MNLPDLLANYKTTYIPELEHGRSVFVADAHLRPYIASRDLPRYNTLQRVFDTADSIVFAGDMFETELAEYRPAEMNRILNSRWGELFNIANRKFTVHIPGNHDPELPLMDTPYWNVVTDIAVFNRWGKKVHVLHGHQLHESNRERYIHSPLGRALRRPERKLQEFMSDSRFGALMQFMFEFTVPREHRELSREIDARKELWLLAHRHSGRNAIHNGYIALPSSNRFRVGWLVGDDNGIRLKKDWTSKYRHTDPVTIRRD